MASKSVDMMIDWVKGHMDKKLWGKVSQLQDQGLSHDKIFNVWCDRMANKEWHKNSNALHDPMTTPAEKWAVLTRHPSYQKITGSLEGIYSAIGYEDLSCYIEQKHNLTPARLDKVNLKALQKYLSALPIFQRASTSKIIHDWIPTYGLCQQGREYSPLCLRCSTTVETCEHIRTCQHSDAITSRRKLLDAFLSMLLKCHTPTYILKTFEYKLSLVLELQYTTSYDF
jgi:hypothetical protein